MIEGSYRLPKFKALQERAPHIPIGEMLSTSDRKLFMYGFTWSQSEHPLKGSRWSDLYYEKAVFTAEDRKYLFLDLGLRDGPALSRKDCM